MEKLVYKILRDTKKLDELILKLSENKDNIKDLVIGVRYIDGNIDLWHDSVAIETLCTISKLLDLEIDGLLQDDNPTIYLHDDDEDEYELD